MIACAFIGTIYLARFPDMRFFFSLFTEIFDSVSFKNDHITKTRLYNTDPIKPHFYIVKLGFTGVYIIFLISAQ